jgi:lipopolysaccharide heptosyltransferase I
MATDAPHRFLIVRLGSLGDVIHAIPATAALRRRYPDAQIDWMVEPRYMDLVRLVRSVDRAVPVDLRGPKLPLLSAFRTLWGTGYDAAIDLQGLIKSGALARAAVPGRVIGLPRADLREPWARIFYSEAPEPGARRHVIYRNLSVLQALGVQDTGVSFPLTIPQTDAVDAVQRRYGAGGYALLNPGAAWPNKRWPPARFGALACALRDRLGLLSVVLWGADERPLAAAVATASGGAAEAAPPTSVTDLFGIARAAALMVSGDTGPLHIAAAVGTPVVALFGPTDPERNGPWSPLDLTVSRFAGCSCHYERRCRRDTPCIEDISVEEVVSAVERRVPATRPAKAGSGHTGLEDRVSHDRHDDQQDDSSPGALRGDD